MSSKNKQLTMTEILIEEYHIILSSIKQSYSVTNYWNSLQRFFLKKRWHTVTHHHSSNTDKARSHSLCILLKFYQIHFMQSQWQRWQKKEWSGHVIIVFPIFFSFLTRDYFDMIYRRVFDHYLCWKVILPIYS